MRPLYQLSHNHCPSEWLLKSCTKSTTTSWLTDLLGAIEKDSHARLLSQDNDETSFDDLSFVVWMTLKIVFIPQRRCRMLCFVLSWTRWNNFFLHLPPLLPFFIFRREKWCKHWRRIRKRETENECLGDCVSLYPLNQMRGSEWVSVCKYMSKWVRKFLSEYGVRERESRGRGHLAD